ncbi:MAG TPA: type II secretion system F family protein [Ktedonobacterales bacterium]|nr:type II secretion system F family protein [Ktedonobacterales bacterium]
MVAISLGWGALASAAPFAALLTLAAISNQALGVGALVALSIILLFLGLQRVIDARAHAVSDRLREAGVVAAAPEMAAEKRARQRGRQRGQREAVPTDPTRTSTYRLASELAQADLKITAGEFRIFSGVLAGVGMLVGLAMPLSTILGRAMLALLLLLAGIYGPRIWVSNRRRARGQKFNEQLPDMINLMAGALRTGYAFMQALELVSREGPEPSRQEFERVVREVGIGLSPEEALTHLVDRMQSEDLNLLVTAVNVQREVGGNLVEVLEVIATTIRERMKLIGEVGVLTAQQQLSGYIIAGLPVGLGLLLFIISPTYMLGMFTETHWFGYFLVGCSGVMVLAGLLIIRRIVDIKV